jgi:hypothetical protein
MTRLAEEARRLRAPLAGMASTFPWLAGQAHNQPEWLAGEPELEHSCRPKRGAPLPPGAHPPPPPPPGAAPPSHPPPGAPAPGLLLLSGAGRTLNGGASEAAGLGGPAAASPEQPAPPEREEGEGEAAFQAGSLPGIVYGSRSRPAGRSGHPPASAQR